jgi:hypothetical protein
LDSLIRYGDDTLGIKPGELKGKNSAISQVRTDLSTLLKKEVPEPSKVKKDAIKELPNADIYSMCHLGGRTLLFAGAYFAE